jgi:cell fate regulator YaaT (PSP1 superfamily)
MREYLVNYGLGGFLGRFRATDTYCRDDRVVVQSARGAEVGSVLGEAPTNTFGLEFSGDILRRAGDQDMSASSTLRERAANLIRDAHERAQSLGLPLLFIDCEILLDGRDAILHAVHWAECDATPLFEDLSRRHGLHVRLADLTTEPKTAGCPVCGEQKSGCDSCGSGGGCSSGSCSKGSVKSADELTAYFAGLRKQMEATADRVSLH